MVDQRGLVTKGFGWLFVNEQTTLRGICWGGNRPYVMNKNISLSGIKEDLFQVGLLVEDGGTHGVRTGRNKY